MTEDTREHELKMLKAYALRWAILAAWQADLQKRGIASSADADGLLLASRVKIASGCISACEVGCSLSAVEARLTSLDASKGGNRVDEWLDLLAKAMANPDESSNALKIPAVKFYLTSCNLPGCDCGA